MTSQKKWPVQEAKARFSELLETCTKEGPQIITKRGLEAAVLVPAKQWEELSRRARPTLKDVLLGPGPRFELPDTYDWRHSFTLPDPPTFDD
ncbi:MAG: type II toxin-antitoxin system Phd/YefM family antitoxin [Chloroflexi bacterium]|nr:type II toxin-antitoxin system Phd/YefM family antitoxin [Chloroflexota bacterium]